MKRNLDFVKNILLETAVESVNDLVDEWLMYARENSPVDTWEFQSWHQWEYAKVTWWIVTWKIYNDVQYAEEVETWFDELKWRKVVWHTPAWEFKDVWANVYEKTTKYLEERIDWIIEDTFSMKNK